MKRAVVDSGGPASEVKAGLDFPHRAPKLSAQPALPRRAPMTSRPPEPPADDPVAGWVKQIQDGVDVERNFERLYKHFHPRLFAFLHRQGLAHEECEELTQDALFKAFEKITTFEHRSSFSTWLREIGRNLCLNDWRRRTTAKRHGIEVPLAESLPSEDETLEGVVLEATEPSVHEEMERKEQTAALHEALSSLPPKMRRCAILRYQHNLKYREIADLIHLNLDTVKAHLGHARQALREKLGPDAGRLFPIRKIITRPGREDEP